MHVRPPEQGVSANFPPEHCANWPVTQACSPSNQCESESAIIDDSRKGNHDLPVQGLAAVRDWNFWLRACASLPFCALKPEAAAAAALGARGADVLAADAAEDGVDWAAAPATPGDWTISVSCCPSGIGPEGFAGQLPGGFRGAFWPNGIVPLAPTALPSANFLGSTPWNWHWKRPLSSAFRGFCWQYGTLRELG